MKSQILRQADSEFTAFFPPLLVLCAPIWSHLWIHLYASDTSFRNKVLLNHMQIVFGSPTSHHYFPLFFHHKHTKGCTTLLNVGQALRCFPGLLPTIPLHVIHPPTSDSKWSLWITQIACIFHRRSPSLKSLNQLLSSRAAACSVFPQQLTKSGSQVCLPIRYWNPQRRNLTFVVSIFPMLFGLFGFCFTLRNEWILHLFILIF